MIASGQPKQEGATGGQGELTLLDRMLFPGHMETRTCLDPHMAGRTVPAAEQIPPSHGEIGTHPNLHGAER